MPEKLPDRVKQKESLGDYSDTPGQNTPIESMKNSASGFNLDKKEPQADSSINPLQQFGMNVPTDISNDRMKDLMGQVPPNAGIPGMNIPPMGMNIPNISEKDLAELKALQDEMKEKIGPGPYSEAEKRF
jgi:hypothetical protein